MKKFKFILILMLVFVLSSFVFAEDYRTNETIRIDAIYTEGGVYAESSANITIEDPEGTVRVSNEGMNESSTGIFYYDYLIPEINGEYLVTVRFYDVNGTFSGLDSSRFTVGGDRLTFGTCPTNSDLSFLWFVIGLCLVMVFIEIWINVPLIGAVGSLGIIFSSLYFFPCSFFIGMLVMALGMFLTAFCLFRKT